MTRADLSLAVWEVTRKMQWPQTFTHDAADAAVESIFRFMKQALGEHENVVIRRFGVFRVRWKAARIGLNPRTGIHHTVSERHVVQFKAGDTLRRKVDR